MNVSLPEKRMFWQRFTTVEIITIIVILAILTLLLCSPANWVSDGMVELPVQVFVFDALHARPLELAHVAVFRTTAIGYSEVMDDIKTSLSQVEFTTTGRDGIATIMQSFNTGANHEHPKLRARLYQAFIFAEADGFGGTVVPIYKESQLVADLKREGPISVRIGLIPAKSIRQNSK